jgi:hypothetical protein
LANDSENEHKYKAGGKVFLIDTEFSRVIRNLHGILGIDRLDDSVVSI